MGARSDLEARLRRAERMFHSLPQLRPDNQKEIVLFLLAHELLWYGIEPAPDFDVAMQFWSELAAGRRIHLDKGELPVLLDEILQYVARIHAQGEAMIAAANHNCPT